MKAKTVIYDGQEYRQIGRRPHVRRDGTTTELLIWRSRCADCGAPFEIGTPEEFSKWPNRRCAAHRAPGRPATPAAGARRGGHMARAGGRT